LTRGRIVSHGRPANNRALSYESFVHTVYRSRSLLSTNIVHPMTSSARNEQVARVVLVTAGLSMTGGVVGALCGVVAVGVIATAAVGVGELASGAGLTLLSLAGGAGALAGMLGAPLLGWGLLRRVPIGRTVVGAVAGEMINPLNPYSHTVPGVIGGALAGFIFAGAGLRIGNRQPSSSSATPLGLAHLCKHTSRQ
jgi:hypothetical protein